MISRNTNDGAEKIHAMNKPDPRHVLVREAIKAHRNDERPPVAFGPSRRLLHSSGRKRRLLTWGPRRRSLDEGDPCPECGYAYDSEEWDCREVAPGSPSAGRTWNYTCPRCQMETCSVGT